MTDNSSLPRLGAAPRGDRAETVRWPAIIQGGMGVGVSGWPLSRAVAEAGGLGVVSGTALDVLLTRRLQTGDVDGEVREALAAFPYQDSVDRILHRYLRLNPKPGQTFRPLPQLGLRPHRVRDELTVVANFVEIYLAKRGHDGLIGINYLEKIQLATPAAVYGAMLAGVDFVLMGAGIPTQIPRLLTAFAAGEPGAIDLTVDGAPATARYPIRLDPTTLFGAAPLLRRPRFLAVVAAHAIGAYLVRDADTCPDGLVVEAPNAGGHSARPRGPAVFDSDGQPVYGAKDQPDLEKFRKLGLPFWLAGGYATPDRLRDAQAAGAVGVQIGTAFALTRESGLTAEIRSELLARGRTGQLGVRNDPLASPTGFPLKVVELPGTVGVAEVYDNRDRICDLGFLRSAYLTGNGKVGYRCPSEPVDVYVAKGGTEEATVGRRCVCNGLVSTVGFPQTRADGYLEPALVTLGQDLRFLTEIGFPTGDFTAAQVVDYLTAPALA